MREKNSGNPYINLWFGNFFEPAFSSEEFRTEGIDRIRDMGFNSILLDSKAWQDFFDRYAGQEATQYVAAQEHMISEIQKSGLSHCFLAIYLKGDNLYPNIRYSPPVFGEETTAPSGEPGKWYKYWSERAQASMTEHVKELYALYGKNATRVSVNGTEDRLPLCSMWDPIVAFSFDKEGISRYQTWLEERYGSIEAFNQAYGLSAESFSAITPEEYWYDENGAKPTAWDFQEHTPLFRRYTDNLRWKAEELTRYFRSMQEKLHALDPALYTSPVLSQWGMFFNVSSQPRFRREPGGLWDTCQRGIDPYRIAPHVDNCTFLTVPILEDSSPSAYASSCQNSMMRAMNPDREFTVGFYLGRYLYYDIYNVITPCEMIGMAAASGASGYQSYGYGGLDDGGVMHKLHDPFVSSVRTGNQWLKRILPKINGRRLTQAAVLYPAQMALTEPYFVEGNPRRRQDLLGYYQSLCDLGLNVDVLHPDQAAQGILDQYRILAVPADSCYEEEINPQFEAQAVRFVEEGGLLLVSAGHPLLRRAFGIASESHPAQCIRYRGEGIIPGGEVFECYTGGEALAVYEDSGKPAVCRFPVGKGAVLALGMEYGAEYLMQETGAVPVPYGNRDLYPLCVAEHDPMQEAVSAFLPARVPVQRGIETAEFEDCYVVVNHTSYPWDCSGLPGKKEFQLPAGESLLLPHSAVLIEKTV